MILTHAFFIECPILTLNLNNNKNLLLFKINGIILNILVLLNIVILLNKFSNLIILSIVNKFVI